MDLIFPSILSLIYENLKKIWSFEIFWAVEFCLLIAELTIRLCITNEYQRMTSKCSTQSNKRKCHINFLTRLSDTHEFVNSAVSRQNSTAQNISSDQIFFKFPYINDTIDGRIKSIIKKVHQQILITRRGVNIRAFLTHKLKLATNLALLFFIYKCFLRKKVYYLKKCLKKTENIIFLKFCYFLKVLFNKTMKKYVSKYKIFKNFK